MRKRVKTTASELPKTSLFSCTFYTEMLVTAIFYKKQKALHNANTCSHNCLCQKWLHSHFEDYLT